MLDRTSRAYSPLEIPDRHHLRNRHPTLSSSYTASINHHASNTLPPAHQLEPLVDLLERQHVRDQVVDIDAPVHVPINDPRHVGAAARSAERRAHPDAAGNELERPRGDLL